MNKRTKQAYERKLLRHGFAPWQVSAPWDGYRNRNWRKIALKVFGVKA